MFDKHMMMLTTMQTRVGQFPCQTCLGVSGQLPMGAGHGLVLDYAIFATQRNPGPAE